MDDKRWNKLLKGGRSEIVLSAILVFFITSLSGAIFLAQLSRTLRLAMGARFSAQDYLSVLIFSLCGACVGLWVFAGLMRLAKEVSNYNDLLANLETHFFGLPKPPPVSKTMPKRDIAECEYPSEFNDVVKETIRIRDGYTCAVCDNYGKQVHHINYDKRDTRFANLITLCHGCHGKTGGNRGFWEGLLSPIAIERAGKQTEGADSLQLKMELPTGESDPPTWLVQLQGKES